MSRRARRLTVVWLVLLCALALLPCPALAAGSARIYVMNYDVQDAIIIESDGHFAMVDAGEDNDYPDGSDARYPARSGITVGKGHEDEVISYLYELGATASNFDVFIGTHAHSDHIGAADEVIREFKPARVYTPQYKDAYISSSDRLWDNQYVYDRMVAATKDVGATLITKLKNGAAVTPKSGAAGSPTFKLGSATITIMNWGNHKLTTGAYSDANDYCWGVKVEAGGTTAFLAADINNVNGDEIRLADQLGHVDVLKLGHHGVSRSNDINYLYTLSPSVVLQTGKHQYLPSVVAETLIDLGCQYFTATECAAQGKKAMMVELSSAGVSVDCLANTKKVTFRQNMGSYAVVAYRNGRPYSYTGEWETSQGQLYIFDGSPFGLPSSAYANAEGMWRRTSTGWWWQNNDGSYPKKQWKTINGARYYFDANGYMKTGWLSLSGTFYYLGTSGALCTGWQQVNGQWFYLDPDLSGAMRTGVFTVGKTKYVARYDGACPASAWVYDYQNWYLTDSSCAVQYGWAYSGGRWYYLNAKTGAMQTGWLKSGKTHYYLDSNGAMATGWQKLDGSWYYFADSGAMQLGWVWSNGSWYWMDKTSGVMKTGWLTDGGSKYYLKKSGAMATGWQQLSGTWYYFSTSGAMQKGWVQSGGSWYYLDKKTGAMLTSAWTPDGCYVNASGAWVPGKTRS